MTADRRKELGRGISVLAGLLLLVAGAESPAEPTEPEVLVGNTSEAVLVLPLNVVTEMPARLAQPSAIVWEDLTGYLQEQGVQLKTARMSDARGLWRDSIRRAREQEGTESAGFESALRLLVKALARHADFATVIVPSLLLREAPIKNRRAEWDGVSRSVEFRAASPETRRLALLTRFEGQAPGASLHVVILDAEGRTLQDTIRGLELLAVVRVVEDPNEPFVYENRRDLFQDHGATRESIVQLLAPFVTAPSAAPQ